MRRLWVGIGLNKTEDWVTLTGLKLADDWVGAEWLLSVSDHDLDEI